MKSTISMTGAVRAKHIRAPGPGLAWKVRNFRNVWAGLWRFAMAKSLRLATLEGRLYIRLIQPTGRVINYGLVSCRVVTTAFVNFMVDEMQADTGEFGDFKYHDSGEGTTGAAVGDEDIETTDGEARSEGTQIEGASANIYKSVGTIAYTTTKAITEHGLFSTVASTTLMDRHVFAAINVENGSSIEFTYELTVSAGG